MRRDSDLSGRRSSRRISGRAILITVGVVFLVVVVFGRAVARFYVDFLWHDGLGRSDVFWGVIRAKLTLFGMFLATFAVLAGVNLLVADRLSPSRFPANVHPYVERFHELFGHRLRLVRYAGAALLAVLVALPTTSQWQSWLLFRNSESFGIADDQFGADVGFYVFELPFLSFVLDWLFVAMVLVLLLTILAHVLNGGILFASPMPSVRPATKGHIAVLLAVLAALKAADYWVSRYETTNERRGFVQGATYAVVNAQLPALMLLMLIALLTAVLYLSTLRTGSWRLPLIASALWLVVLVAGGLVYPALVQSLVVNPNQQDRELPYIERNVEATREAMGINLDEVDVRSVTFDVVDGGGDRGRPRPAAGRAVAQPDGDALAVPPGPGHRRRVADRRPRRRPLRDRRAVAAGADGRARARRRRQPEPELAGPPPHQHPWLRPRPGAGRPGAEQRQPGLPARRAGPPGAVLQPQPERLRRRPHVGGTSGPAVAGRRRIMSATRACRCRRSSGGRRSLSPSSTTTCSARAPSSRARRCCGCATSATG